MYKQIMLAYDGSEPADKALDERIRVAKQTGSRVFVLYVLTPHHLLLGGGREVFGLAQIARQHTEALRYADGYDVDDWLEAEAEVDHTVLHPAQVA